MSESENIMQDIIKVVETVKKDEYKDITKDDLLLIMLKAKAIVSWEVDNKDAWKEIASTLERFTITAKAGNQSEDAHKYALGTLHPIIRLVESYYNDNAVLFVPDETKEQIEMKAIKGYLWDVICKVQTMQQDGWKFRHNKNREFLFNGFNMAAQGFLDATEKDESCVFEKDVCDSIKKMWDTVNKEFNTYWANSQSQNRC